MNTNKPTTGNILQCALDCYASEQRAWAHKLRNGEVHADLSPRSRHEVAVRVDARADKADAIRVALEQADII